MRRTFLSSDVAGDKVSGLDVGRLAALVMLLVLRELALTVILGRKREDLALGDLESGSLLVALLPYALELADLAVQSRERRRISDNSAMSSQRLDTKRTEQARYAGSRTRR